ncbi:MAG: UbiA family prenyltransferase [Candidatus Hermodarchaeota archaeon]
MEEQLAPESLIKRVYVYLMDFRFYIGVIFAVPYLLFGFLVELALLEWNRTLFFDSLLKLIFAIMVSLMLLPFIWVANDYFDAPYDLLEPSKRDRNYYCSNDFKNNPFLGYIALILPLVISLTLSCFLGLDFLIISILTALIGYFYSAPPLRFKEMPVTDFITHGFYVGGFFFILGGLVIAPLRILLAQPLFLILFFLSVVDMANIQYNSQLLDIEIDNEGSQRTTSLWIGKQHSLLILRGLMGLMLACVPLYLTFNSSLVSIFPLIVINSVFILSLGGILLYFWFTRGGFEKIKSIQNRTVWLRHSFIYLFALLSILFINMPSFLGFI